MDAKNLADNFVKARVESLETTEDSENRAPFTSSIDAGAGGHLVYSQVEGWMDVWEDGWFDGWRKRVDKQQKTDGKMDLKVGRCRRVGAGGDEASQQR